MPPSGTLAKDWSLIEAGPIAMPESPEHLRMLIEEALVPMLGRRPLVDEDGDFVVPVAGALVFVRVVESAPVVADLQPAGACGVEEPDGWRCATCPSSTPRSRWSSSSLVDDRIVAGCTLPANPFVGSHLRELLSLVGRVANDFEEPRSLVAGRGPAYGA